MGSVGRFKALDHTYFESNCLTALDPNDIPLDSFSYTLARPFFFAKNYNPVKCSYWRQRCRLVTQAQFDALPAAMQNKASIAKKRLVIPGTVADPCPEKPYPDSCFNAVGDCTCDDGSLRDKACPDQVTSQGLHNFIVVMSENAMQLADAKPADITANNAYFRFLIDYDKPEWALGIIKAILLHQHEAIAGMQNNTLLTIAVYGFITVLIMAQYAFLGMRIQTLITRNTHISKIVDRLETLSQNWEATHQARDKLADDKGAGSGSDSVGSDFTDEEADAQ